MADDVRDMPEPVFDPDTAPFIALLARDGIVDEESFNAWQACPACRARLLRDLDRLDSMPRIYKVTPEQEAETGEGGTYLCKRIKDELYVVSEVIPPRG